VVDQMMKLDGADRVGAGRLTSTGGRITFSLGDSPEAARGCQLGVGPCEAHDELVRLGVERNGRSLADIAGDQRTPDAGLDLALDVAAKRTGTVDGVVPTSRDELARGRPPRRAFAVDL
jgi:hypothetical protein